MFDVSFGPVVRGFILQDGAPLGDSGGEFFVAEELHALIVVPLHEATAHLG